MAAGSPRKPTTSPTWRLPLPQMRPANPAAGAGEVASSASATKFGSGWDDFGRGRGCRHCPGIFLRGGGQRRLKGGEPFEDFNEVGEPQDARMSGDPPFEVPVGPHVQPEFSGGAGFLRAPAWGHLAGAARNAQIL